MRAMTFPGVTGSLVRSLAVFQGELYAGGDLVAFSGDPADWIARWTGTAWAPLGQGLNGVPFTLLPDDAAYRAEIRNEMETTGGWENWYRHVGKDWNRVVIGQAEDGRYAMVNGLPPRG